MEALLFGSIGTLGETSNLQREAFNAAFAEAGLPWVWDKESYAAMLRAAGGQQRIAAFAERHGKLVDVEGLHHRKSEIFQDQLGRSTLAPRPGVSEAISAARQHGLALGLVTSTSPENVAALLGALRVSEQTFDVIVTRADVEHAKPAPDPFLYALDRLRVAPEKAVAVEDNPDGAAAAIAAGVSCIVTPGAAHAGNVFDDRAILQERLDLSSWLTEDRAQRRATSP